MKFRISHKYTAYFAFMGLTISMAAFFSTYFIIYQAGTDFKEKLGVRMVNIYEQNQMIILKDVASYLSGNLFDPLYTLDVDRINYVIDDLSAGLPVISFSVADIDGTIITEGRNKFSRYGKLLSFDSAALMKEKILTSQVENGYKGIFVIGAGDFVVGFGEIVLANDFVKQSIMSQNIAIDDLLNTFRASLSKLGLFSLLFVALLAAAMSIIFSNTLSRPLIKLKNSAQKVAQGDLTQQVRINQKTEIGELAISFNKMVQDLQRDVEEKALLERQLRQAHKMEAIGTMAGGIAHDFNNILSAILGYADIAKDDIPPFSPAKLSIEQIIKAGYRAKELVWHILSFSHMSTQAEDLVKIDPCPIVKEVLEFQRSIIPTSVEIKSDIDEECGHINANPIQIHQVIMNLCTNAAHAMEGQGGTLEICVHKTEVSAQDLEKELELNPGAYIKLSVRDTGAGMTPELINKIFDPYFTTKKVGKGSGMGLAVVQSIVKTHGGFVKVESDPGKGSTFNVYLPSVNEKSTAEDSYNVEEIPAGTERILFVDDDEMLADIGKSSLERLGYSVTGVTDSNEALELFQRDPSTFDLVITDQAMPIISGAELSRHLLQIRPDIPIILCTGYSSIVNKVKALEIGIRAYMMKPTKKGDMARLIRKTLDEKKSVIH